MALNIAFKPKRVNILGFELAGIIEEVGKKVKSFKKDDSVFALMDLNSVRMLNTNAFRKMI